MADYGGLREINLKLEHLQQGLTPVHADKSITTYMGRGIKKLERDIEAGIDKIIHFLATGKWESKQQRGVKTLVEQLKLIKVDFDETSAEFHGLSGDIQTKIRNSYAAFNKQIAARLNTMTDICQLIKIHPEKVDTKAEFNAAEKEIRSLILKCDREINPREVKEKQKPLTQVEKKDLRQKELAARKEERKRVPREKKAVVAPQEERELTKRERTEARSGKTLTKPQQREEKYQERLAGTKRKRKVKPEESIKKHKWVVEEEEKPVFGPKNRERPLSHAEAKAQAALQKPTQEEYVGGFFAQVEAKEVVKAKEEAKPEADEKYQKAHRALDDFISYVEDLGMENRSFYDALAVRPDDKNWKAVFTNNIHRGIEELNGTFKDLIPEELKHDIAALEESIR